MSNTVLQSICALRGSMSSTYLYMRTWIFAGGAAASWMTCSKRWFSDSCFFSQFCTSFYNNGVCTLGVVKMLQHLCESMLKLWQCNRTVELAHKLDRWAKYTVLDACGPVDDKWDEPRRRDRVTSSPTIKLEHAAWNDINWFSLSLHEYTICTAPPPPFIVKIFSYASLVCTSLAKLYLHVGLGFGREYSAKR